MRPAATALGLAALSTLAGRAAVGAESCDQIVARLNAAPATLGTTAAGRFGAPVFVVYLGGTYELSVELIDEKVRQALARNGLGAAELAGRYAYIPPLPDADRCLDRVIAAYNRHATPGGILFFLIHTHGVVRADGSFAALLWSGPWKGQPQSGEISGEGLAAKLAQVRFGRLAAYLMTSHAGAAQQVLIETLRRRPPSPGALDEAMVAAAGTAEQETRDVHLRYLLEDLGGDACGKLGSPRGFLKCFAEAFHRAKERFARCGIKNQTPLLELFP